MTKEKKPGSDLPQKLWRSYLGTALWSSIYSAPEDPEAEGEAAYVDPRGLEDQDPLDNAYAILDFDDKSLEKLAGDVREFLETSGVPDAIASALIDYDQDDEQVGHDLWLTQNHHGAEAVT